MSAKLSRGFTLLELIVAMVVISVGLAGLLMAFNVAMRHSADPVANKQMLAVAEGLIDEILLKPHAVNGVALANSPVSCGSAGAERGDFDDVRDYHAYETSGVCDIDGAAVAGLAAYRVRVDVLSGSWQSIPDVLTIQVSVTRDQQTLTLTGRRTPYAQ